MAAEQLDHLCRGKRGSYALRSLQHQSSQVYQFAHCHIQHGFLVPLQSSELHVSRSWKRVKRPSDFDAAILQTLITPVFSNSSRKNFLKLRAGANASGFLVMFCQVGMDRTRFQILQVSTQNRPITTPRLVFPNRLLTARRSFLPDCRPLLSTCHRWRILWPYTRGSVLHLLQQQWHSARCCSRRKRGLDG